jgi:hypothetical protein
MVDFSGVPVKQRWAWAWTTRHGVECTGQEAVPYPVQYGTGCISIRVTTLRPDGQGGEPGAGERKKDKQNVFNK